MPFVKSNRDRGRWGTWLRQERLKRGLSPEQVREMLAKRGYRVGESTYAEWESGYKKQPAREAIPHLTALWGSEPEPEREDQPLDSLRAEAVVALTDAIREQTAVFREMLALMQEDRSRTISPEALGFFLQQLRSEGMLTIPERPASTGALDPPSPARPSAKERVAAAR